MMTSQILKPADFIETLTSRMKHYFFSNIQIHLLHIKGYFMAKNSFLAVATFKRECIGSKQKNSGKGLHKKPL